MSAAEFYEWWALYEHDPWGESRADLRMGILASTIANRHRDSRREPRYTPQDFLPHFGETPEAPVPPPAHQPLCATRQTSAEIEAMLGMWASA